MADNMNKPQEERREKVIKGTAKLEKKPLGKRVVDFLFSDRLDSMGNYLVHTYLGPGLANLFYNLGVGALGMLFGRGGGVPPQQSGYIPGYGYRSAQTVPVNYNGMSQPGYAQPAPGYVSRVTMNDISFDTKDDAWLVLDRMTRECQRYGRVRVADYYLFAGITGQEDNWTLQSSGWYNLGDAHPMLRTDGRWVIEFPPVQSIR